MNDTDIVKMIIREVRQMKPVRDSLLNLAFLNDWEWGFYLKPINPDSVIVVEETTDSLTNQVTLPSNIQGSRPKGEWHCHQDALPKDRHPHDPQDVKACTRRYSTPYYTTSVDCGDVIYVIVNLDPTKIKAFARSKIFDRDNETFANSINQGNNRKEKGLQLLLDFLGSSEISGLALYEISGQNLDTITRKN